ncbi:MAG: PIN domain-containing protein [bacterium]|nr:PIN domain-containing protein [bacterium]
MQDKILVDASIFVAIAFIEDPHHLIAKEIFHNFILKGKTFVTNNYIYAESLTVALIRSKNIKTVIFLKNDVFEAGKREVEIIKLDFSIEKEIVDMMLNQQKYKSEYLSFADCSLIVQARKQKIKTIFTFDKTFKQFEKEFDIRGI